MEMLGITTATTCCIEGRLLRSQLVLLFDCLRNSHLSGLGKHTGAPSSGRKLRSRRAKCKNFIHKKTGNFVSNVGSAEERRISPSKCPFFHKRFARFLGSEKVLAKRFYLINVQMFLAKPLLRGNEVSDKVKIPGSFRIVCSPSILNGGKGYVPKTNP